MPGSKHISELCVNFELKGCRNGTDTTTWFPIDLHTKIIHSHLLIYKEFCKNRPFPVNGWPFYTLNSIDLFDLTAFLWFGIAKLNWFTRNDVMEQSVHINDQYVSGSQFHFATPNHRSAVKPKRSFMNLPPLQILRICWHYLLILSFANFWQFNQQHPTVKSKVHSFFVNNQSDRQAHFPLRTTLGVQNGAAHGVSKHCFFSYITSMNLMWL